MDKGHGACRPDERFQCREGLFDWIEIRAEGRQEAEVGADGFDAVRTAGGLWTARLSSTTTLPARSEGTGLCSM